MAKSGRAECDTQHAKKLKDDGDDSTEKRPFFFVAAHNPLTFGNFLLVDDDDHLHCWEELFAHL